MKIRSITYFCNPSYPLDEKVLRQAGEFLAKAKSAYEAAGYEVQTTRLATVPFPKLLGEKQINDLPKLAQQFTQLIEQNGIEYASLGPAVPESPRSYQVIPEAIAASQNIFFGGIMADEKIHLDAIRACAEVIVKSAPLDPNGFANLRFAALANVKAGAPFFPAAYHDSNNPSFAIATEAADLAVSAFDGQKTVDGGRRALIESITKHGQVISATATQLPTVNSRLPTFFGIDFSLAPFPDDAHSLGNAVEKMGIPKIGLHGSLAAAAILTEAVDRADFPHTGFSGFLQPVLEDSVLARRAAEGALTIKDLLLYSTVCGTGLDTVPLPGDTTAGQIIPLLLDLCALALRLDKPLTARLMPVPGKKAGDATNFDFGFFANSKVMALDAMPLISSLGGDETFSIQSRTK
ncbi:MAG: DUF711 family protein [Chloroflexi bacterium]|nr:DUF711 family protein [Chloroflexota bacterium]MBI3338514.1 DUF711 family protein [Chloroflexota bacterium]